MKITKEEKLRREKEWLGGGMIFSDEQGECACCGAKTRLRHIHPGPGDICLKCYTTQPLCSVAGCKDIAVEYGKCREHFLEADDTDLSIDFFGGIRASSIAEFAQLESFEGMRRPTTKSLLASIAKTAAA